MKFQLKKGFEKQGCPFECLPGTSRPKDAVRTQGTLDV
jgi:hypothetical protein